MTLTLTYVQYLLSFHKSLDSVSVAAGCVSTVVTPEYACLAATQEGVRAARSCDYYHTASPTQLNSIQPSYLRLRYCHSVAALPHGGSLDALLQLRDQQTGKEEQLFNIGSRADL